MVGDVEDATRIVQKFLVGRGDVSDLSGIMRTIDVWRKIKERVELEERMIAEERVQMQRLEGWANLRGLMERMEDLSELGRRVMLAVGERESVNGMVQVDANDGAEGENEIAMGEDSNAIESDFQSVEDDTLVSGPTKWTIKPELVLVPFLKCSSCSPCFIRYSPELKALHDRLSSLNAEKEQLERRFQHQYGQCMS